MSLLDYYKLDKNNKPVLCQTIDEWCNWFMDIENRRVAFYENRTSDLFISVSTVFIGVGSEPFETLTTFTPNNYSYSESGITQYSTWNEAILGHNRKVIQLKAKYNLSDPELAPVLGQDRWEVIGE